MAGPGEAWGPCGLPSPVPADAPAPHEINFAPWPPCLSHCVCLSGQPRSANPPFVPKADTGHQGTVGCGPGATIACAGNGAGAQVGQSGHSASRTPDSCHLPASGLVCGLRSWPEGGSKHPSVEARDSPGLSWGWGSPETPGPRKRGQPFHGPILLGLVPLGQVVCTPGHLGLSFLRPVLGPATGAACLGRAPRCRCGRDYGLCALSSGRERGPTDQEPGGLGGLGWGPPPPPAQETGGTEDGLPGMGGRSPTSLTCTARHARPVSSHGENES